MPDALTTEERIEGYKRLSNQISEMGITIGRLEKRLDECRIERDEARKALGNLMDATTREYVSTAGQRTVARLSRMLDYLHKQNGCTHYCATELHA